ncbi:E3 ubiquitin-protein ligase RNF123-like protein [Leptotrombidium deliense]|uniref:E3 ubiquitin-protein ligase RNF123-like protein n=1 Tax=Leptotrombidium deliense TaxID=299467 RepID=A0A443SIT6_9ACAR|nr:E3 ubiquitin-protein ligase RNF123-like protein [Leptotrombidium deliense]
MKKHNLSHELFLKVFTKEGNSRLPTVHYECDMEIEETTSFAHPSFITYESLQFFIDSKLKELETNTMQIDGLHAKHKSIPQWSPYGRLGADRVLFDVTTSTGHINIDFNRLSISSHSGFSSIRANVGVFKGKWMYEVMLGTKGVMQVGWATNRCRFSQEKGVGDTPDSYAYDGNRVRKWNLNTFRYGDTWHPGDVIGITMDLEEGCVAFYRNGRHLGQAFNNVKVGQGMVYFPAVSLAYNESLVANFGATPLRYPVDGYHPLEAIPYNDICKANLLFEWTFSLILMESRHEPTVSTYLNSQSPSRNISCYLILNLILERLAPLITNRYIIEACLLKKLLASHSNQEVHLLLDLFWALLEVQQIHECLEYMVSAIINGYRYSNIGSVDNFDLKGMLKECLSPTEFNSTINFPPLETTPGECSTGSPAVSFTHQKQYLLLFLSLVQHPRTRIYLLQHTLFDKVKFPQLLEIRPILDNEILEKKIFPNLTVFSVMNSEAFHCLKSKEIEHCLTELESLHHMIIDTLIFQDEFCRKVFLAKFDSFIKENRSHFNPVRVGVGDIAGSQQMSPLPVLLCFFHRLTSLIRIQYENMINVLPISFFVESSCVSNDITRVGGVVSHLSKTYEREISQYIETASSMNPLLKHVYILIDGLIKLYSIGAHKQLGKHCAIRETLSEFANALEELDELDAEDTETKDAIQKSTEILEKELLCRARQLAWINSTVLTASKRADIHWLLKLLLNTLEHASSSGCLFGFIPDYYIESCLNLCFAIRFYFGSTNSSRSTSVTYNPSLTLDHAKECWELIKQFSTFIASHFADERVANSDLRDSIAQALASLVSNPETLKALESISMSSRQKMITSLTAPYENRAWAQSNWILLRLWKGDGYAYRYTVPPNMAAKVGNTHTNKDLLSTLNYLKPCPSQLFQNHVRDYLTTNKQASNAFISSLLSQLNWSFSEFIGMLQEIQNAANRPEKVFIDSRQLKICCTCFDLTLALLRVIEMISTINPLLITIPDGNDLILTQLCTMLNQILNRITVPTGCFEFITDLDIPGLELVAHFPILTAVTGILVALILKGPSDSKEMAMNAFVADASFLPTSILYLCGKNSDGSSNDSSRKSLCLANYEEVNAEEVESLEEMTKLLIAKHENLESSKAVEDIPDDEMCTICYANRKTALFVPCSHKSCKACISMHFLRNQECFFCKTVLDRVVFTNSDEVLYPKK